MTRKIVMCLRDGYPPRTKYNVINSNLTIAIADDFTTAGEKLTKDMCRAYSKLYISVDFSQKNITPGRVERIVGRVNTFFTGCALKVNIAGNGRYGHHKNTPQSVFDNFVWDLLTNINGSPDFTSEFIHIRSGGQTGIDEAGIYAAEQMGIDWEICAPKGFMYRDENGVDIFDEAAFKARFPACP